MNAKSQTFLVKITQLNFPNQKKSEIEFRNPKRRLKINNIRNNSNREPIKTFNRIDCLSEDELLNEIPEGNGSNEKLVSCNKSGKSDNTRQE